MSTVPECEGQCCAVFPWPTPPAEMRRQWEDAPYADWDRIHAAGNGADQLMIADMLVPLTDEEADERCERFGIDPNFPALCAANGQKQLYTCKNWDEETKLCTVYEARPDMCATYPYAKTCFHCKVEGGCTNGPGWRKEENAGESEIC